MVGTPVFRMVVSSDSMKNATAISQGSSCLLDGVSEGVADGDAPSFGAVGLKFEGLAVPSALSIIADITLRRFH